MIRPAHPYEAEALATLHRSSILAHCSGAYSAEQIDAWTAELRPEVYSALLHEAAVLVATAEAEGDPVGVGVCSPEAALINAAYVGPGMTRRGFGRELMDSMEALLVGASAREARLNATLNAVAFYRALGYRDEGPALNRLPSGLELPCVAMSKPLY